MRLEHEILSYLVKNPDAKDTLEGIVEWWLMEQRIRTATTEVQAALAGLAARGLIVQTRRSDGRWCYELNHEREQECLKFLVEGERGE